MNVPSAFDPVAALRGSFTPKSKKGTRISCGQVWIGSEYNADQIEWLRAISNFQTCYGRLRSVSDPRVLRILKSLGYRKVKTAERAS